MTQEALYVGGGKEKVFREGNSVINIDLNLTELEAKMEGHTHEWRSRKGGGTVQRTVRLILAPLKNPDERRTHSLRIDTWKPEKAATKENKPVYQSAEHKRVAAHFAPHDLPNDEDTSAVPF